MMPSGSRPQLSGTRSIPSPKESPGALKSAGSTSRHRRLQAIPGKGVKARFKGRELAVGGPALVQASGVSVPEQLQEFLRRPETAIRLCLVIRGDLEGERLTVPERRAAVESEIGNAEDGELHCYEIARFAVRVIGRCLVDGDHFTVRKGGGVEVRRFKCILVEPETDRAFRFHLLGSLWR